MSMPIYEETPIVFNCTQKLATADFGCPIFSKFGRQANLIIGGGPHINTNVSGDGKGICARNISSFIKPVE